MRMLSRWMRFVYVFLAVFAGGLLIVERGDERQGAADCPVVDPDAVRQDAGTDEFIYPVGTKVLFCKANARGWKFTGVAPMSVEAMKGWIDGEMTSRCYRERNGVGIPGETERMLSEWQNADGRRMLWMLWRMGDSESGFSWGVSK